MRVGPGNQSTLADPPPSSRPPKLAPHSDVDLARWKEYPEILTDSLWLFEGRDRSGSHLNWYHGNFVPQIPRQLILRYTKKGDWILDPGRYLALVIGGKYHAGKWIPLGFYAMQEAMRHRFDLKSIVVKNFDETRGKAGQRSLWRYRALQGGYYLFKHEYVFIFRRHGREHGGDPPD